MDPHDFWEDAKRGISCVLCPPRPANNEHRLAIAQLSISTLYLFRDQRFRGYSLLVFDACHATELTALNDNEYCLFMADLRHAMQAIRQVLRPDHMNCECLGNSTPHPYWHIVPRYRHDPRWGRPIWEGWPRNEFTINRVCLPADDEHALVQEIRLALEEDGMACEQAQ